MSKSMKILVVDDMKTIRKVVSKILNDLGYENIEAADDGIPAWEMLQAAKASNTPFDFIISDWNMPGMLGIDLLKKVRADAVIGKTKFLMLTAETEKTNILIAVKAGVSDFTMKPFTKEILAEKINRLFPN